ncbi:MAG: hypothetical protein KME45_31005 [Stenomitos rutilans HA7619-LM2]|nr:hypothetical protein [Stenomitos rutilans HA7619-LM2]
MSNAPVVAEKGQLGTVQTATVEIAHEVLLMSWKTLEQWITENRKAIALRSRINDDAAHWQKEKQEGDLLPDSRLAQALDLRKNETFQQVLGGFSEIANQFIDASDRLKSRELRRTRIIAGVGFILASLTSAAGLRRFLTKKLPKVKCCQLF